MATKKRAPAYKPYWHYVIRDLRQMTKGHSCPLERLCLRHGFRLVQIAKENEDGNLMQNISDMEPPIFGIGIPSSQPAKIDVRSDQENIRAAGYKSGQLYAWEQAFNAAIQKLADR